MEDSTIILSIGSNCGDRECHVKDAVAWLCSIEDIVLLRRSDIYETSELYGKGDPYMNAVVEIRTSLSFELLQDACKMFEISSGRDLKCREQGLVPIDIDIVMWNNEILRPKDHTCDFFKIGFNSMKSL